MFRIFLYFAVYYLTKNKKNSVLALSNTFRLIHGLIETRMCWKRLVFRLCARYRKIVEVASGTFNWKVKFRIYLIFRKGREKISCIFVVKVKFIVRLILENSTWGKKIFVQQYWELFCQNCGFEKKFYHLRIFLNFFVQLRKWSMFILKKNPTIKILNLSDLISGISSSPNFLTKWKLNACTETTFCGHWCDYLLFHLEMLEWRTSS